MNIDKLEHYLAEKLGSLRSYPFGADIAVYKVKGKMFALYSLSDQPCRINLKCDPDEAVMLRDVFEAVIAGYHMNKKHWNTVILDGSLPDGEVIRMIDNSYALVVKGLTKQQQKSLLVP